MPYTTACRMLEASEILQSQELLASFKIADWPNTKPQVKSRIHKQVHKIAYPFEWTNTGPLSLEEAAKKLQGLNVPKGTVKRG